MVIFTANFILNAQTVVSPGSVPDDLQLNSITTAVPFLTISPDARGGALGDAGVSTSADENSIHWNPAKLAFVEQDAGASITFSPWLRNLVGDISLSYLSGYYKLNRISTIGTSLRYFSLGTINFTDNQGGAIGSRKPYEMAFDVAYSMKLADPFSVGVALRYINSNLTGGSLNVQGTDTKAGHSVAADISAYYVKEQMQVGDYDATFRAGLNISNIGAKMAYTQDAESDFIPTNLRLGPSLTLDFDDYNSMTFLVEANKLLVPTPPIYKRDSTGAVVKDTDGNPELFAGQDPNVGLLSGIFGSFNDAPGLVTGFDASGNAEIEKGSVFREELSEITYSAGVEYWYDKQFAVRIGYFHEHKNKGNRRYLTAGLGLKMNVFALDISYLVGNAQQNPLANTARFSLKFNFEAVGNKEEVEEL